jgi:hypothetical protein
MANFVLSFLCQRHQLQARTSSNIQVVRDIMGTAPVATERQLGLWHRQMIFWMITMDLMIRRRIQVLAVVPWCWLKIQANPIQELPQCPRSRDTPRSSRHIQPSNHIHHRNRISSSSNMVLHSSSNMVLHSSNSMPRSNKGTVPTSSRAQTSSTINNNRCSSPSSFLAPTGSGKGLTHSSHNLTLPMISCLLALFS